nr:reverse transcriptase domain-containing protein [Tanacetum cinerariifolium]
MMVKGGKQEARDSNGSNVRYIQVKIKNLMDKHKVVVDVKIHGSELVMESVSVLDKRPFSCRVMSSPNHPTSDIEDAFSSNSLNYTPASSDYSPASSRNTPSKSLNNSYGLVLITSPTLLLFHDDPYMKVMHAYDAIIPPQVPIPPPAIVPPSPIMAPKRTSTSTAPAMNQSAIRQLIDDHVAAALEAQATNMANTDNTNRNPKPREILNCTEDCKVKFATGTLTEDALSWWNSYANPIGIEQADKIAWSELKSLLTNKYFSRTEVKKMEDEFYNFVVKGNDLKTYAR